MEHKAFFEQLLSKPINNKICTSCGFLRENDIQSVCPQCGDFFKGKELSILDCLVINSTREKRWKERHFKPQDAFDICVLFNSKLSSLKKEFLEYCDVTVNDYLDSPRYLSRLNEKIQH